MVVSHRNDRCLRSLEGEIWVVSRPVRGNGVPSEGWEGTEPKLLAESTKVSFDREEMFLEW